MTEEENVEMAEKIFDAFCVDETHTLNHVECIEAMMEFGAWVAKNLHKPLVSDLLPHDSQIDAALDKLLIIRGEHPARVRNPLYGEERELAKDLLKYILLSVDCRNRIM